MDITVTLTNEQYQALKDFRNTSSDTQVNAWIQGYIEGKANQIIDDDLDNQFRGLSTAQKKDKLK